VTFNPTATGPLNGSLTVNSTSLLYTGLGVKLSGNGVDFALGLTSTSGTAIAGDAASSTATLTPIAGFSAPVTLTCTVSAGATASSCGLASNTIDLESPATAAITISTTSQYTVVGYSGLGGRGYLWLVAACSGWMLWVGRRRASRMLRSGLLLVLLASVGLSITGCSGQLPAKNPAYTGPGSYAVTVSATDGFLVRTATYNLTVVAN
jgi:hypothetical protein